VRIVCLSAEAADICARLGAWEEVVAVSAFASQSELAPRPVIGGFSATDCERVAQLRPDLVLCFSDVQAEIAAQLIRLGCTVLATNQRTLAEIAGAMRLIGGAIGRGPAAEALATEFLGELAALQSSADPSPRVYFEEWPEPLISGIGWVGELIELCGGIDIFAARRGPASRERVVQPEEIIAADPDIIIASWCGRPVNLEAIRARPGFSTLRALQDDELHVIASELLLQPGPAVLAGARELHHIFQAWRRHACIPTAAHPP
jgi:iron complex transport system substrate-binding protein